MGEQFSTCLTQADFGLIRCPIVELKSLETCLRQTCRKLLTYPETSPHQTNHTSVMPVPNQAPKAQAAAGGALGTKLGFYYYRPGLLGWLVDRLTLLIVLVLNRHGGRFEQTCVLSQVG